VPTISVSVHSADVDTEDGPFLPVLAVMLYPGPTDAERRARWLAAKRLHRYELRRERSKAGDRVSVAAAWLHDLWNLNQAPQRTIQDGLGRMERASFAGLLLQHLLLLHRHCPRHCQVHRAIAAMQEIGERGGAKTISESLLEKSWARFQSVSHLWAAISRSGLTAENLPWRSAPSWISFLGLAEGIRVAAEDARILDPAETWRFPDGLAVPPVPVRAPPMPRGLLKYLDSQFPP